MTDQTNALADAQKLSAQIKNSNDDLQKKIDGLADDFKAIADGAADDFEKTESELVSLNQKFLADAEADVAKTAAKANLALE